MPLKIYLDKRQNKHGEAPIRVVWSFNGDRYQTTMGFSIPPKAWDDVAKRVTPAEYNHKNTPSTTINAFIEATERAVNRLENYARVQNATLTKPIVKQVIADVLGAGGEYPAAQEPQWKKMLKERGLSKARYFEHFKGGSTNLSASEKIPRLWRMWSSTKLCTAPARFGCGRTRSFSAR